MTGIDTPQWQPLSALAQIARDIDEQFANTREQYDTLLEARDRPHGLDDAIVTRFIRLITGQERSLRPLTQLPQSRHSVSRTPKQPRAHRMAVSFNASTLWIDTYDRRALASSRTECYRQRA
jgi:hypothetical protein